MREDPRAYGWFLILLSGGIFSWWVALDQGQPTRKVELRQQHEPEQGI